MNTAKLFRYGDINYWTANYAEGGADLMKAAAQVHRCCLRQLNGNSSRCDEVGLVAVI